MPSLLAGATCRWEAARRRAFAIISPPDAAKATLTKKFVLYGGAVTAVGPCRV